MNIREWALPVYTILTQLAVGALFVSWVIRTIWNKKYGREYVDEVLKIPMVIILMTAIAGIIGAHFHLSKPYLSFLAVLNFHSSWLSREITFDLFFILSTVSVCFLLWFRKGTNSLKTSLGWAAIVLGFTTDYCMSRIYLLPTQPAWNSLLTPVSFIETTLLLGVMAIPVMLIMDANFSKSQQLEIQDIRHQIIPRSFRWLAIIAALLVVTTASVNYLQTAALRAGDPTAQISVVLLLSFYQTLFILRYATLVVGVGWLCGTLVLFQRDKKESEGMMTPAFLACLLVMIAEILGRFLFFAIHVRIGV